MDGDRGVFVLWQRGRGEASFGLNDDRAGDDPNGIGGARGEKQGEYGGGGDQGLLPHWDRSSYCGLGCELRRSKLRTVRDFGTAR